MAHGCVQGQLLARRSISDDGDTGPKQSYGRFIHSFRGFQAERVRERARHRDWPSVSVGCHFHPLPLTFDDDIHFALTEAVIQSVSQ